MRKGTFLLPSAPEPGPNTRFTVLMRLKEAADRGASLLSFTPAGSSLSLGVEGQRVGGGGAGWKENRGEKEVLKTL